MGVKGLRVNSLLFFFCHFFLVNAISWASPDYGLMLACGSSDGSVSIISSSGENNLCDLPEQYNFHCN